MNVFFSRVFNPYRIGFLGFMFFIMSTLTACGFELRGYQSNIAALPFNPIFLQGDADMLGRVTDILNRNKQAIATTSETAQGDLAIAAPETKRVITSTNYAGYAAEYTLTLLVSAVATQTDTGLSKPIQVRVNRRLKYDENDVLAKADEEAMLWEDMRREAAANLVQQLSRLSFKPSL
jgi:LPS-assembly lipoprotein